jgi:fructose-specific phosphotransferase system IIA component
LLFNSGFIKDKEEVVKAALIREKEFTTGVGLEVAIPHAKSSFVIKPGVAFGRSRKGLEWDTVDGLPPKLIFLIVVPTDAHDQRLQVLAQISRKIIHDDVREKLLQALEAESILETLK